MSERKPKRVIVCAAVMLKDGRVICGVRHFDEIMLQSLPPNTPKGRAKLIGAEQGFVDNSYKFVGRKLAYKIAMAANQVIRVGHGYCGEQLFSEDLY